MVTGERHPILFHIALRGCCLFSAPGSFTSQSRALRPRGGKGQLLRTPHKSHSGPSHQARPGPHHPQDTPPEPPFLDSGHKVAGRLGKGSPEKGTELVQSWASDPGLCPVGTLPSHLLSTASQRDRRVQEVPPAWLPSLWLIGVAQPLLPDHPG